MLDASVDMVLQDLTLHLSKRSLHRSDLGENVDAERSSLTIGERLAPGPRSGSRCRQFPSLLAAWKVYTPEGISINIRKRA